MTIKQTLLLTVLIGCAISNAEEYYTCTTPSDWHRANEERDTEEVKKYIKNKDNHKNTLVFRKNPRAGLSGIKYIDTLENAMLRNPHELQAAKRLALCHGLLQKKSVNHGFFSSTTTTIEESTDVVIYYPPGASDEYHSSCYHITKYFSDLNVYGKNLADEVRNTNNRN